MYSKTSTFPEQSVMQYSCFPCEPYLTTHVIQLFLARHVLRSTAMRQELLQSKTVECVMFTPFIILQKYNKIIKTNAEK